MRSGSGGSCDVAVVGLGAVGSAACWELTRRGAAVLGLDRFSLLHARGSSHGDSRMVRLAYYEHPDYVPLLRRAYAGWEALEQASGQRLLYKTGGLYMGRMESPGELVPESLRAAREHELPHELLDRDEVRRRYPTFELPEDYGALWEPEAGFVLPERAIAGHLRLALEAGARIHGHQPVIRLEIHPDHVQVVTPQNRYRAGHVVLAGGPWSAGLLAAVSEPGKSEASPPLELGLQATRQVMAWVWPDEPGRYRLGEMPVWAVESERVGQPRDPDADPRGPHGRDDPGGLWYGFPILGNRSDRPGMKVGNHFPGPPVDPDRRDFRVPRPEDAEALLPHIQRYAPGAVKTLLGLGVCLYTMSPDGHFVVDRHPAHPDRISFACGLSGHGFKLAPALGRLLADWALEGTTELPVGFLGVGRLNGLQFEARSQG